jgi:hypothetical protein
LQALYGALAARANRKGAILTEHAGVLGVTRRAVAYIDDGILV